MKWATSRGTWGSAMSIMRRPWEYQAKGISVPVTYSQGWWQAVMAGWFLPSMPTT
jgi:hypothetical protein